jgi:acetyl esterase
MPIRLTIFYQEAEKDAHLMKQPADIDPEILVARALQGQALPVFDITKLEPAEGRRLLNQAASVLNDGFPEVDRVETFSIEGPGGPLRVRLYQPAGSAGRGAIYYIHGGGWFACDVDTHDRMLRVLAAESGSAVFAIDYRLSPEHVFPAALDDCLAGWRWLRDNGQARGIGEKIAISGDSAGANLSLGVVLTERDAGRQLPVGAALFYGAFAPNLNTASAVRYGQGPYGLTAARMAWYWQCYLGPHAAAPPVLATPLNADFHGLPPIYLGTGECDVLADDSRLIAEPMRAAGVDVTLEVWPRLTHGVLQMTRDVRAAHKVVVAVARRLAGWVNED